MCFLKKLFNVFFVFIILLISTQSSAETKPFNKGSRYLSITGGHAEDLNFGSINQAEVHYYDYIRDNFAFLCGFSAGHFNTYYKSGFQFGPKIGIHKDLFRLKAISIYFEFSIGGMFHQYPLTDNSLRFNFELQGGFGAKYSFNNNTFLQGGFKWNHLSNARIMGEDRNLGFDGPMPYVGLMWKF